MKFQAQVRKSGGFSNIITIDSKVVKKLGIKDKDMVEVDIINVEKRIMNFRCKKCQHRFDMENDNPYCPSCENINLEVVENA